MESYKVGALADLISAKSQVKSKKSKSDLSSLFVSKLPPKPKETLSPKPIKRSSSPVVTEAPRLKKVKRKSMAFNLTILSNSSTAIESYFFNF